MQVSTSDLKSAWNETDWHLKKSLEIAYERIKKFHEEIHSFTIKGKYGDSVQRRWKLYSAEFIFLEAEQHTRALVLMNAYRKSSRSR